MPRQAFCLHSQTQSLFRERYEHGEPCDPDESSRTRANQHPMCTAPTSASAPPPTCGPTGSRLCPQPKTTRSSRRWPRVAAGCCGPCAARRHVGPARLPRPGRLRPLPQEPGSRPSVSSGPVIRVVWPRPRVPAGLIGRALVRPVGLDRVVAGIEEVGLVGLWHCRRR